MAFTPGKSRKVSGVIGVASVILVIVLFLVGAVVQFAGNGNGSAAQIKAGPTHSATPSPKGDTTCSASWKMVTSNHAKNRWFGEGMASILDAKTNADAVAAAPDFSERVSQDAPLLVAAAKAFHVQDNVDIATLTDSKGCATDATVKLKIALDVAIATAHSITLGEAPINGTNTGVENGQVVSDVGGTIGGNRKAIQIVLSDGSTIWIMARCGNIVTSGPPIFPPGKTDSPPKPTPTPTPTPKPICLPPTPHGTWPDCKDGPVRAPNVGTQAPTGAGNNADPGSGTYVPPAQVQQPPAKVYTAPPAPPAAPPPAPTHTVDPAPAPSPEPSAPTPADPAQGCSPPPGMTTC